jgi:hypothetical protein
MSSGKHLLYCQPRYTQLVEVVPLYVLLQAYFPKKGMIPGFDVLILITIKNLIFWDITARSPMKVNRRFRGTLFLNGTYAPVRSLLQVP